MGRIHESYLACNLRPRDVKIRWRSGACCFVRFREGLLAGERFMYGLHGLLSQLGQPASPPSGTSTRPDSNGRGRSTE